MSIGKSLKNQVALITGGSSGIGKAIAKAMGESGAKVAVNYLSDKNEAYQVVQDIQSNGESAIVVQADVSQEDQVMEMFRNVYDKFGTIDMVNNAGIQKDAKFLEMSFSDWQMVLNVNLTGSFLCAREAAKEFCRRGLIPERSKAAGKIIFISSVHDTIARVAVWSASDEADYITGTTIYVDRGMMLYPGFQTEG